MKSLRKFSFIILSIYFQSISDISGKFAAISIPKATLFTIITNSFSFVIGEMYL